MPYFTMRDGEQVFAHVFGKGESCILVQGLMAEASDWNSLVRPLRHRYQFILMDMRGAGKSGFARLGKKPVFTQFAEDLDDLMDALGIEQAKLVGCSLGSYACLIKHKITGYDRISSVLLYEHPCKVVSGPDFAYGINPNVLERYRDLVQCLEREQLDDPHVPYKKLPENFRRSYESVCVATASHALTTTPHCASAPWKKKLVESTWGMLLKLNHKRVTTNWHGMVKILDDYINHDYGMGPEDLKKIKIPVTIMFGRHSDMFPNEGIFHLQEHIPDTTVIPFEKSGHAFFITEAFRFKRELAQFFAARRPHETSRAGADRPAQSLSHAPPAVGL